MWIFLTKYQIQLPLSGSEFELASPSGLETTPYVVLSWVNSEVKKHNEFQHIKQTYDDNKSFR